MGHGLLKKLNFYFIFSEKINFPGKMPLKCSNNAQCFCLTKMLEKCQHNVQKPRFVARPHHTSWEQYAIRFTAKEVAFLFLLLVLPCL